MLDLIPPRVLLKIGIKIVQSIGNRPVRARARQLKEVSQGVRFHAEMLFREIAVHG